MRSRKICNLVLSNQLDLFSRYSNYVKLIHVIACLYRFANLCKTDLSDRVKINKVTFSAEEKKRAFDAILRLAQADNFEKEIEALKTGCKVSKSSTLFALNPFLDEDKILRVGGRLENSLFSFEKRHPAILHAKCKFAEMYVRHLHVEYFHASRSFLCNFLASKYWLVGGLSKTVKKVTSTCVTCIRYSARPIHQLMGQLPLARVSVGRPFNSLGVDFAGPFSCKCVSHRTVKFYKIYVAFFVCLCTRAVHIETVSNLSTEAFLECFQRFVARRGVPQLVYSDNATNFVGAQQFLAFKDEKFLDYVSYKGINWRFIPPRTPHQGGVWESVVRSAKYHLIRVTNGQTLNYEQYQTLFTTIEGILNSRPICYRKNNVETGQNVELLTPGHFLVGSSLLAPCPIREGSSKLTMGKLYSLFRSQIRTFWIQWSREYLNQYQTRNKWRTSQPNVKIGDVVLLKETSENPSQWKMGIITQVFPDAEGFVRIVDVKSRHTIKRRAITSIVKLLPEELVVPSAGGEC